MFCSILFNTSQLPSLISVPFSYFKLSYFNSCLATHCFSSTLYFSKDTLHDCYTSVMLLLLVICNFISYYTYWVLATTTVIWPPTDEKEEKQQLDEDRKGGDKSHRKPIKGRIHWSFTYNEVKGILYTDFFKISTLVLEVMLSCRLRTRQSQLKQQKLFLKPSAVHKTPGS